MNKSPCSEFSCQEKFLAFSSDDGAQSWALYECANLSLKLKTPAQANVLLTLKLALKLGNLRQTDSTDRTYVLKDAISTATRT